MELKELPKCPVETTLRLIGEKWRILIIRDLLTGTKRFGELKKVCSGISQKVLAHSLRKMEDDGLVKREEFAEKPPRVEYTLTDVGYSLAPVLDAMASWGTDYKTFLKLLQKMSIPVLFLQCSTVFAEGISLSCSKFTLKFGIPVITG